MYQLQEIGIQSLRVICIIRVSYRIFCWGGGNVFSHASTKHVNVGGSGGIPPRKMFSNLASLRLILVQFFFIENEGMKTISTQVVAKALPQAQYCFLVIQPAVDKD